jgi:mono/diheme cytochrome c family protein
MIGLLALVLVAQTQSCVAAQQTYAAPVQYQQTYNQAYVQNAYVEKTIFVAVENYGELVGQQQRAAARQEEAQQAQQVATSTDAKIDQLTRLVLDLQKRLETQQNEPPIPSKPAASAAESPRPSLPALSPVASEAVPLPPTVAQAASVKSAGLALLVAKCGACHTGAAQKGGGFTIFAADGSLAKLDAVSLDAIDAAIASGRMPKRAPNLTLREYAAIRDYLNEQASGLAINTNNQRKKIR